MKARPTLFTYKIVTDAGSAPNPYWGTCTLAICKPKIRSVAQVGDWVAGLGVGAHDGHLVYAMRVTDKLSMRQYDSWTRAELPEKIPDLTSRDKRRWFGDSLYDFARGAALREGVHEEHDRERDMSGQFVLLSTDFVYFGSSAPALPEELQGIRIRAQGHKGPMNDPYLEDFVRWIRSLAPVGAHVLGSPHDEDEIFEDEGETVVKVGLCSPD